MNKLPLVLVGCYLILVIVSLLPLLTEQEPMSGVFAVMLTMPWSWLIGNVIPASSKLLGYVVILVGAIVNASILGAIARWIVNR